MKESIIRQVINEAKKKIQKRLDEIKALANAKPLTELMELRKEVAEKLNGKGFTEEGLKFLQEAAKKEKKLLALSRKQMNKMLPDIDEEVELGSQWDELVHFEFMLSRRRK